MNLMIKLKRREFVRCLVDLTTYAISYNMLEEAELLTRSLHQLRPKLEQLDFFDGWIAALRGDWRTASMLANGTVARTGDWPFASILLAYTQFAMGDPTWRTSAERAAATNDSPDAKRLMLMLLGEMDPKETGVDPEIMNMLTGTSASNKAIKSNFVRA